MKINKLLVATTCLFIALPIMSFAADATDNATTPPTVVEQQWAKTKIKYNKSFDGLNKQLQDDGRVIKKIIKYKTVIGPDNSGILMERVIEIRNNVTDLRTLCGDKVTITTAEELTAQKNKLKTAVKFIKNRIKGIYTDLNLYRKTEKYKTIWSALKTWSDNPENYNIEAAVTCKDKLAELNKQIGLINEYNYKSISLIQSAWTNPNDAFTYSYNYKPAKDTLKLVNTASKQSSRLYKQIKLECPPKIK